MNQELPIEIEAEAERLIHKAYVTRNRAARNLKEAIHYFTNTDINTSQSLSEFAEGLRKIADQFERAAGYFTRAEDLLGQELFLNEEIPLERYKGAADAYHRHLPSWEDSFSIIED